MVHILFFFGFRAAGDVLFPAPVTRSSAKWYAARRFQLLLFLLRAPRSGEV